ncbi:hypothetical protein EON63_24870 [archaeon]|nr:MAG: hypothetical protein EON63_24870 [archaeon]
MGKLSLFTHHLTSTPTNLFNTLLVILSLSVIAYKSLSHRQSQADFNSQFTTMPKAIRSLQWRFLIVFWLLRMADWLQGPFFYEVCYMRMVYREGYGV